MRVVEQQSILSPNTLVVQQFPTFDLFFRAFLVRVRGHTQQQALPVFLAILVHIIVISRFGA